MTDLRSDLRGQRAWQPPCLGGGAGQNNLALLPDFGGPFVAVYRFRCPACGKTLKVDDAMLADIRRRGKGGHCPRCKSPVSVAEVDGDHKASPPSRPRKAPRRPPFE